MKTTLVLLGCALAANESFWKAGRVLKTNIRQLDGSWDLGFALDKHTIRSTYTGDNEFGHPTFDTLRTEVGEGLHQLKNRQDWDQVEPLAEELADSIFPKFRNVGLIIPMPPSTYRKRQPVFVLAEELGKLVKTPVFGGILKKKSQGIQLKNLKNKGEKLEALEGAFSVTDEIDGSDSWNALLIDDLFDTGASTEMACMALRQYAKISRIYVATLTWK